MSMAMSLYGGDHSNPPANPYLTPSHALHPRLARNPIEMGARSLPRPRRKKRKPRVEEKPLYPSIAAVEEAVPETIIRVNPDNGTLDIRVVGEPEEEEEECMEEEKEKEQDRKPAALQRPSLPAKSRRRSSNSSEKLTQSFRNLSVKRKPQGAREDDDDPLSTTAGGRTLAPRRKVSRQSSKDSLHSRDSRASADSGDSSSVASSSCGGYLPAATAAASSHRRTDSMDSSNPTETGSNSFVGSTLNLPSAFSTGSNSTPTSSSSKKKSSRSSKLLSSQPKQTEIEAEPGLFLPLRGTEETHEAVKRGFVEEIFCQNCDIELIVTADASYCECPDCKSVTPVDGIANFSPVKSKNAGTVGLGVRAHSNDSQR